MARPIPSDAPVTSAIRAMAEDAGFRSHAEGSEGPIIIPPAMTDADERVPFILDLASALHQAGHATYRLEEGLEALEGNA